MRIKLTLALLLSASLALAESRTYVIYRALCYPNGKYALDVSPQEQKRFVDAGKKTIERAEGQPYRITSYSINFDGKYALFTVDDDGDPDKDYFRQMESKGCAKLITVTDVVTTFDPAKGGHKTEGITTTLSEMPTDYYYVDLSTPTGQV